MKCSVSKVAVAFVVSLAAVRGEAVPLGYQKFGYVKDETLVVTNAQLAMTPVVESLRHEIRVSETRLEDRIETATNAFSLLLRDATNALRASVCLEIQEAIRAAKGGVDATAGDSGEDARACVTLCSQSASRDNRFEPATHEEQRPGVRGDDVTPEVKKILRESLSGLDPATASPDDIIRAINRFWHEK